MYKKIALSLTLLIIYAMCIFADRGDSVSYTISYNIASDSLDMRSVVDDLYDFLSTFYTVKKEHSVFLTEKYDWKKYNRYKNNFGIHKQDMYLLIKANIEQRQPYLFYKEQDADYYMYLVFKSYGWFDDRIDEYIIFGEDVAEKIHYFSTASESSDSGVVENAVSQQSEKRHYNKRVFVRKLGIKIGNAFSVAYFNCS